MITDRGSPHNVARALREADNELVRAMTLFPPINTPHEGKAVIEEELEELWALIKADRGASPEARREAIQLAAMALRYVVDLT